MKSELIHHLEEDNFVLILPSCQKAFTVNINCTEKSCKYIFALSPNFVQGEWCHYELYWAHYNPFHESSHDIIFKVFLKFDFIVVRMQHEIYPLNKCLSAHCCWLWAQCCTADLSSLFILPTETLCLLITDSPFFHPPVPGNHHSGLWFNEFDHFRDLIWVKSCSLCLSWLAYLI